MKLHIKRRIRDFYHRLPYRVYTGLNLIGKGILLGVGIQIGYMILRSVGV